MTNPILKVEDLRISFHSEDRVTDAVKGISFEVHRGEILAIVGESGSGKSVTSLSILQLLPGSSGTKISGSIKLQDDDDVALEIVNASKDKLRKIRGNRIAMIFQEPMSSLNPVMKCGEQVMEAILIHQNISKKAAKAKTIDWFRRVKLPEPEKIIDRYPHQLSGGQKQRVMIAMAMCCEPSVLICDEPTTALDVTVQKTILELIKELQKENNMGVVFITHDLGVVAEIADRVAIMYRGEILEEGGADKIFSSPDHAYTRALIACRPANHPKGERLPVVADFLNEASKQNLRKRMPSSGSEEVLMEVKNLVVDFPVKTNILGKAVRHFRAVDQISFEIFKGETLGLVGESGCGKTTVGRTLMGLVKPSSGEIVFVGKNLSAFDESELKALRKNVQLVFQDPYSSLNPRLTISTTITEPMAAGTTKKVKEERAENLLEKVDLSAAMLNRYPHEFSGGQRQRIVIARALAVQPGLLICDESVSALDVSVQAQVLNLLNDLKEELGLTMLFISHDLSVIRYMCDRMLVMNKGKIVEHGNSERIYKDPQHPYTQKLLAAVPSL